mgnify:CR=1 FL=1
MRTTDKRRLAYIEAIKVTHSEAIFSEGETTFSRKELRQVSDAHGWKWIPNWITHDPSRRTGRGVFSIPEVNPSPSSDAVGVPANTDDMSTMDAERIADNILVGS